jgi:hypothetical protein
MLKGWMRALGYALGCALLVAIGYMGSYYASVKREGFVYFENGGTGAISWACTYPTYRCGANWAFSLAHEVDLRIRPVYWSGEAYLEHIRAAREARRMQSDE